jgi:hypothetical protein
LERQTKCHSIGIDFGEHSHFPSISLDDDGDAFASLHAKPWLRQADATLTHSLDCRRDLQASSFRPRELRLVVRWRLLGGLSLTRRLVGSLLLGRLAPSRDTPSTEPLWLSVSARAACPACAPAGASSARAASSEPALLIVNWLAYGRALLGIIGNAISGGNRDGYDASHS